MRETHRGAAMTVHCPHCLTGYELPESLMGAGGARVRCPGCQGVFVVMPDANGAPEPATSPRPEPAPELAPEATEVAAPPVYQPSLVACAVIDVMVDFLGAAMARSRERGTVLSDHGPAIVAVWDEYRRRVGADAPAGEFLVALRDRCGVNLAPRAR